MRVCLSVDVSVSPRVRVYMMMDVVVLAVTMYRSLQDPYRRHVLLLLRVERGRSVESLENACYPHGPPEKIESREHVMNAALPQKSGNNWIRFRF